jgi:hypothetical protein
VRLRLERLIDARLATHAEESRAFYAARAASRATARQPDLRTPEGLDEARALELARAAPSRRRPRVRRC